MDLNLSLAYSEQNDNKAIILTDDTANYDALSGTAVTGAALTAGILYEIVSRDVGDDFVDAHFRAADNNAGTRFITNPASGAGDLTIGASVVREATPAISEITAATLDTTVTGVSKVADVKSQADLYTLFSGPWAVQSELVYTITSVHLDGDATAALLEDGLYALEYNVTYSILDHTSVTYSTKTETLTVTILVYGQVKVLVYDKVRQIPAWCNCEQPDALHNILDAELCAAYLNGIENSAYLAKTEELLNMLIVLDDMITNGNKITY